MVRRDRNGMLLAVDLTVRDAAGSSHRVAAGARMELTDEGEICPTLS